MNTNVLRTKAGGNSASAKSPRVDWIWSGILRPGKITLMLGGGFTGKSTLLSGLLR